jgi:hypothetical protein
VTAARGCSSAVGLSLPAGALGSQAGIERLGPALEALSASAVPLFVHPGPAAGAPASFPALTAHVAEMATAWHAWAQWGRQANPELRVVFAMPAKSPKIASHSVVRGSHGRSPRARRSISRRQTSIACDTPGGRPAVTIHAYSSPLWRMGAYAVLPGGELRRHPLSYAEELRPLESSS